MIFKASLQAWYILSISSRLKASSALSSIMLCCRQNTKMSLLSLSNLSRFNYVGQHRARHQYRNVLPHVPLTEAHKFFKLGQKFFVLKTN